MPDHAFNIAEAKMHLSRLIERVERGERITIARNNRPVAVISPVQPAPEARLARMAALREEIRAKNAGRTVLLPDETWQELIEETRRSSC